MAGKTYLERRSIRSALDTYLSAATWTGLTFKEGFMSEATIVVPLVTIEIVRPTKNALELGDNSKLFKRTIQIDCYMESEPRAMQIADDIMDFMDITPVVIVDNNSATLGSLICQDTDSIYSDILPPELHDPKLIRWRSIIRGEWEAFYNGS